MQLDVLAAVICVAAVQSLFGVGVLLFGTPILLLLGHDFVTILATLLPVSLAINLLQVARHHAHVDRSFYVRIVTLSVPCIMVFLFLVTRISINIGAVVGLFLIVVAFKSLSARVQRAIESLVSWERSYFAVMGIVHGLTNLGGSLLTAIIHSKHYPKDAARTTAALSYGTFALFQLITLALALKTFPVAAGTLAAYVLAGLGVFLAMEQCVYSRMSSEKYHAVFSGFLLCSGIVLLLKGLLAG